MTGNAGNRAPSQEHGMPMGEGGVGQRLRNAREARGLSLDEIEAATRIRRRFLEAIEAEDFDQLPGPAYAKGFLRTYATYLGLPAEDVAALHPALRPGPTVSRASPVEVRITPATPPSRARRVATGIAAALVIGLAALGYVLYGQIKQFEATPAPGSLPASSARPRPTASSPHAPSAPQTTQPPVPAPPQTSTPGQTPAPAPAQAPAAPLTQAAGPLGGPSHSATAPSSAASTVLAGPITVVAVASDRSWVRTVADGVTVFEGFLSAGDRQAWQAHHQLTIRVGNASALSLTVNGRALGVLGRPGDVVDKTFVAGTPVSP
jgi:cytoskeleton protein RodZ